MTEQLFWQSIRRLLLSAAKLIEMKYGKAQPENGNGKQPIAKHTKNVL